MIDLPPLFLQRMENWLGPSFPAFLRALQAAPRRALRVNTLKIAVPDFAQRAPFALGASVPWCPEAFYLPADVGAGQHPWHRSGLYYLQDPSALAPGTLLAPAPGERILDLTAAPGGKATHVAAQMAGRGLLVANEIKSKRVGHLAQNMERWGAENVVILNETPERLAAHWGASFDRVLVDAPCSGEGMFRKDMRARRDWSPEMVQGCALRQQNILHTAARLVRAGGYLLYSTCTFAPEENEAVLAHFLAAHADFSLVDLPAYPGFAPGQPEWLGLSHELKKAVRLWPHLLEGDGHFVACLRRSHRADVGAKAPEDDGRFRPPDRAQRALWLAFQDEHLLHRLPEERLVVRGTRLYLRPPLWDGLGNLRVVHPGVWLGTFKTRRFEPAHPLALFLRAEQAQHVCNFSSDSPQLQAYLRGEVLPRAAPAGWTLVTVDGFPLGWGKQVGQRLKNHYPRGWLARH